jgi:hypothetical protein
MNCSLPALASGAGRDGFPWRPSSESRGRLGEASLPASWPMWKRPRTASATLPSTSTWRSREKVKVPAEGGRVGVGEMGVTSVGGANRAGVAEQAAKDVGEEVGEQGGFLEIVRAAGCDEFGPVLEFGLPVPHALRQVEGPHLLAEDFRVEERFGFEGHWDLRFTI